MKTKLNLFLPLIIFHFFITGCNQDDSKEHSIPIVQTLKVKDITETTASSGGLVLNDGGASVITKGICWDIKPNPTTTRSTKTIENQETSLFNSTLSNLIPNQKYYVRAYATNSIGISYGNEISFFTKKKYNYLQSRW